VILKVGPVWTRAEGDSWEVLALKKFLTVDDDHPTFLDYESDFPSGLLPRVVAHFTDQFALEQRIEYEKPRVTLDGLTDSMLVGVTLRDYQMTSARKLVLGGRGVVELPTGSGKTEMFAAVIRHLYNLGRRKFLFLADRVFLVQQGAARMQKRGLGEVMSIGMVGDGNFDPADLTVSTVDTLDAGIRRADSRVLALLAEADVLLVDECHHVGSERAARVTAHCDASERFGATATLCEVRGEWGYRELTVEGMLGPMLVQVPGHLLREKGYLARTEVTLVKVPTKMDHKIRNWHQVYSQGIVQHRPRNSAILSLVDHLWRAGRRSLVFVGQKDHGRALLVACARMGMPALFSSGGGKMERVTDADTGELLTEKWDVARLAAYVETKEPSIVIATQVLDEGVDVPHFDSCIIGVGHKKMRRLLQRIGRGMRPKEGDRALHVFDFHDQQHWMLRRHAKARQATYAEEKIPVVDLDTVCRSMGLDGAHLRYNLDYDKGVP
jgi:superfamily II DNA or RNA helicase